MEALDRKTAYQRLRGLIKYYGARCRVDRCRCSRGTPINPPLVALLIMAARMPFMWHGEKLINSNDLGTMGV